MSLWKSGKRRIFPKGAKLLQTLREMWSDEKACRTQYLHTGRRKMWATLSCHWRLCYCLHFLKQFVLFYWNGHIFVNFSFIGIWNPNPPRPFLYYQTWGTVSCGRTCRSRKGKLWCLQTAWCNATTPNSQNWIQSCVWHSLNWVYLKQCFSKHVPWKISSARRLHGQTNLDKCLLCFPSWCF